VATPDGNGVFGGSWFDGGYVVEMPKDKKTIYIYERHELVPLQRGE